ncbi:MAG TPA: hypothetical protein VMT70_02415, partial [Vicinamibacteria bacterium]|nr:hypothetical protein [Vicinamibacteria bacterium]
MRLAVGLAIGLTLTATGPLHAAVETLPIDLAHLPVDQVVELEAKDAHFFLVRFLNYGPAAVYRVREDWQLSPDRTSFPGGAGKHEYASRPAPILPSWEGDPCGALASSLREYQGIQDEGSAAARAAEITKQSWEGCPESQRKTYLNMGMPEWGLPTAYSMEPGDMLEVTVERLDAVTGHAQRTWRFEIRVPPPYKWEHPTERHWIASEVIADLAEMAAYASDPKSKRLSTVKVTLRPEPAGEAGGYVATVAFPDGPPLEERIHVQDGIWSPRVYGDVASRLVARFRLKGRRGAVDSPLERLLEPTFAVLEDENDRLSKRLEKDMTLVAAHEQAALLLGALGLREAAGDYSDTRGLASRMTAHLAFAAALRGDSEPSLEGRLADALLVTLAGRQVDALERASRLPTTGVAGAWRRAVTIRNTGDWRILEAPAKASLLERREHYRALAVNLGTVQSTAFLGESTPEPVPDWPRLAFDYGSWDVGTGNRFASIAIPAELSEIGGLWQRFHPGLKLQLAALNGEAGRCVDPRRLPAGVRVIDWGTWAGHSRRHLLHAISSAETHYRKNLGIKEEAEDLRKQAHESFTALDLFPTLTVSWGLQEKPAIRETSCHDAARLIQQSPQSVSAAIWYHLAKQCRLGGALPRPERWMDPPILPGTAHDVTRRWPGLFDSRSEAHDPARSTVFQEARRMAPYSAYLASWESSARQRAKERNLDLAALWGPLAEYNLTAMHEVAAKLKAGSEEHRRLYERLTRLDPDSYVNLGWELQQAGLDEEAAAAFEQAYEKARDQVRVSHSMEWLVDHYFDHGRKDRAFEIAGAMAEVYSAPGLLLQARMLERSGRIAEAESWYQREKERYDDKDSLDCFYLR